MNVTYKSLLTEQRLLREGLRLFLAAGLLVIFTAGLARAEQPAVSGSKIDITVYKTEFCGCCTKWTDYLEENGFNVDVIVVKDTSPDRARLGIPRNLASCHTAKVGNYWVEGHVPADLISRLMQEQPADIKGIAVPGMPPGSPGMEVPNPSAYKILSVNSSGEVETYATRQGISSR